MTIQVVFVTSNTQILDLVKSRKVALVPHDIRADGFSAFGGEEIALSVFHVEPATCPLQLSQHLITELGEGISGILLLSDNSMPNLADVVGDVFSVNCFEPPAHGANIQNVVQAVLAKVLRNFRYYRMRFNDLKYRQILRLPLRNFSSGELDAIQTLCHDMFATDFGRQLDRHLASMRSRQRPKKTSSRPDKYYVDDDDKHFRLGPEVHAQAETAIPPHSALCVLGNRYRFGILFDGQTHFNVSRDKDDPMTGQYVDCHGVSRPGDGGSHLNMFSNDYF